MWLAVRKDHFINNMHIEVKKALEKDQMGGGGRGRGGGMGMGGGRGRLLLLARFYIIYYYYLNSLAGSKPMNTIVIN